MIIFKNKIMKYILVTFLIMNLTWAYIDITEEIVYVDPNGEFKDKTKFEIEETGRYEEVFSDHVVQHSTKQIHDHMSSSTEDIISVFKKEQILLRKLLDFLSALEKLEEDLKPKKLNYNTKKLHKCITSMERFPEVELEKIAENPVAAFNIVWRTARVWPQKIKTLTAHLKMMKTALKSHKKLLAIFPTELLAQFPITDTAESTAAARGLLTLQHYANISCQDVADGMYQIIDLKFLK